MGSGSYFYVPSDWYFMVLFEVDYDKLYGEMKVIARSWVQEYGPEDVYNIENSW